MELIFEMLMNTKETMKESEMHNIYIIFDLVNLQILYQLSHPRRTIPVTDKNFCSSFKSISVAYMEMDCADPAILL